eukprot:CAMPEP_0116118286 /NCGR_PEP_ID=MMETSP0329-20121206/2022_1 /TAXON_ID=697910 /ORGANISM="Pseudo-nitzschia arenysensis, Strain B593" /LENGTH=1606 /DNA_ID=CAMNT_0003611901 /DNA_START=183 /DNA_END=5000 /DNA_ORIENTATION=+
MGDSAIESSNEKGAHDCEKHGGAANIEASNGRTVAQKYYDRRQISPPSGTRQRAVLPVDNSTINSEPAKGPQHAAESPVPSLKEAPPSSPSLTSASPRRQLHLVSSQNGNEMDVSENSTMNSSSSVQQDFDRISTREEEKYVMQKLSENIEFAEVSLLSRSYEMETLTTPWRMPRKLGPYEAPLWGEERPRNKKKTKGKMDGEIVISRRELKQTLPRWIPGELGSYDSSSILFTRPQFVEKVILKAEERIASSLEKVHHSWRATLEESPRSYLMEASGSEEALDVLEDMTQTFVREQIERVNFELLVEDGASLIVTMKCNINLDSETAQQALGVTFSSVENQNGVYIKSIKPRGALARALGDEAVYNRGCALLDVSQSNVSTLSQVEERLLEAKWQFPQPRSPHKVEVSLLLSKFADLSESQNVSKWKISRKDGLLYDKEEYDDFRLRKYMQWVKQQSKNEERDATDDDDKEKSSSESSSYELSSSDEDTASSYESTRSNEMAEIADLSDSDSTMDSSSFAQMDDDSDEDKKPKAKRKRTALRDGAPKQKVKPQGYAIFRTFEQKVKPLIGLDYKDTNINIKSICSSMWKKHKELFGEDERCGENCRCLMWLPNMVENVITDHMERQREKNARFESEKEIEKRTRGIAKNFVPKFIAKLQEEYPAETETQLVKRLLDMWDTHHRSRLFGFRCLKGCACEDQWDQIFGKGDKIAARDYLSGKKRPSPQSQCVVLSGSATSGPLVPRKKRLHEHTTGINSDQSKKPRLTYLISSMVPRVNIFNVVFDTSAPIGGYFRTRMNQCVVFSMYLKGAMANEPKITNGTIVVSVKTDGKPVAVTSHSQLQKIYEGAKQKCGKILISFENKGSKQSSISGNRMNNVYWNESGQWMSAPNLEDDGWAGGAQNAPKKSAKMKSPLSTIVNKITDNTVQTSRVASPLSDHDKESDHQVSVEEWTTIVSTEKPGHRLRMPTKSLVMERSSFLPEETKEVKGLSKLLHPSMKRSRRERTHSKRVQISTPNNQEIYFCKDDAPNTRRILQIKLATEADPKRKPQLVDLEQSLISAVRNKTCTKVLEILESQELQLALSEGSLDLELLLMREYSYIGNKLKELSNSDKTSAMDADKIDLSAKYRILSIYIHCIHLIEKTLALKKWYELSIEMRYINLQQKSTIVDEIGGKVVLKLDDGTVKEDFDDLPLQKFTQQLKYVDDDLKYTMYNNKGFRSEKRRFVVDLKKVSDWRTPDRVLGTFDIKLDDIENKCLSDGKPTEITESLSDDGFHELSSGHITLNVSKKSASKDYILAKKQEIIRKLRTQLEYIDRFNQDPNTPPGARLTANIACVGGKSILHAAVLLIDDKDLVQKMLWLGANPRGNYHSGMGTPLSLAQRNLHSAIEKERNMRIKGFNTEQHIHRCNQARALVEMLQKNVIENPTSPSTIAEGPTVPSKKSSAESQSQKSSDSNNIAASHNDSAPNSQDTSVPIVPKPTAERTLNSPMPKVERYWASSDLSKNLKKCKFGVKCHFFAKRECMFWHSFTSPMPNEKQPPLPPLAKYDRDLPTLSDANIHLSHRYASDGNDWWTAAYTLQSASTVIYAHKVLDFDGIVDKTNGVVW